MSETQELDIESITDVPEEILTVVSPDYTSVENTPPGKYLNESRRIEYKGASTQQLDAATARAAGLKTEGDGKVAIVVHSWQVSLAGLVDRTTGRSFKRPDFYWLNTRPRREKEFGTQNFKPGTTSDVKDYLSACGFSYNDVKNLSGLEVIKSAIDSSVDRPVMVTTGLEPKGKDSGTLKPNGKKLYRQPQGYFDKSFDEAGNPVFTTSSKEAGGKGLYTSSFKRQDETYARSITVDGEVFDITSKVERFGRVGA
jgi:hypothetical protein